MDEPSLFKTPAMLQQEHAAKLKDEELVAWLEKKFGESDFWSARTNAVFISQEMLEELQTCFQRLQSTTKLKIVLTIPYINQRNMTRWQETVKNFLDLAARDADDWVETIAGMYKDLPTHGVISTEIVSEEFVNTLEEVAAHVTKHVSDHSLELFPKAYRQCGDYIIHEQFGDVKELTKHFTLKKKPNSFTFQRDVEKQCETQANLAKQRNSGIFTSSVPIKMRSTLRKGDNQLPMKGIPTQNSLKLNSGFTNEPKKFQRQLSNKKGGALLLDISDLPPPSIKKRRQQESEAEKKKKMEEKEAQKKKAQQEKKEKEEAKRLAKQDELRKRQQERKSFDMDRRTGKAPRLSVGDDPMMHGDQGVEEKPDASHEQLQQHPQLSHQGMQQPHEYQQHPSAAPAPVQRSESSMQQGKPMLVSPFGSPTTPESGFSSMPGPSSRGNPGPSSSRVPNQMFSPGSSGYGAQGRGFGGMLRDDSADMPGPSKMNTPSEKDLMSPTSSRRPADMYLSSPPLAGSSTQPIQSFEQQSAYASPSAASAPSRPKVFSSHSTGQPAFHGGYPEQAHDPQDKLLSPQSRGLMPNQMESRGDDRFASPQQARLQHMNPPQHQMVQQSSQQMHAPTQQYHQGMQQRHVQQAPHIEHHQPQQPTMQNQQMMVQQPTYDLKTQQDLAQADEIINTSNRLTAEGQRMIIDFMMNKGNPAPHLGDIATLTIGDAEEDTVVDNVPKKLRILTYFQMNYVTRDWKRMRKLNVFQTNEDYLNYLEQRKLPFNQELFWEEHEHNQAPRQPQQHIPQQSMHQNQQMMKASMQSQPLQHRQMHGQQQLHHLPMAGHHHQLQGQPSQRGVQQHHQAPSLQNQRLQAQQQRQMQGMQMSRQVHQSPQMPAQQHHLQHQPMQGQQVQMQHHQGQQLQHQMQYQQRQPMRMQEQMMSPQDQRLQGQQMHGHHNTSPEQQQQGQQQFEYNHYDHQNYPHYQ